MSLKRGKICETKKSRLSHHLTMFFFLNVLLSFLSWKGKFYKKCRGVGGYTRVDHGEPHNTGYLKNLEISNICESGLCALMKVTRILIFRDTLNLYTFHSILHKN